MCKKNERMKKAEESENDKWKRKEIYEISVYKSFRKLTFICNTSRSFYCANRHSRKILLDNLTGLQLVKKFPAFYGNRRFITAFTSARHLSLSWARSIHSIPPTSHFLKIRLNIILSSAHGLFPSGFHTITLYTPFPSHIRATCPAHSILLDFNTRTILCEQYRSLSSSLCSFLHSPVTSSLLGPNILLNTLFSNFLSPRFSLNVSDQVSHTYKTTGKNIVLYVLIYSTYIYMFVCVCMYNYIYIYSNRFDIVVYFENNWYLKNCSSEEEVLYFMFAISVY